MATRSDAFIELASRINDLVMALNGAYQALGDIISDEQAAIKTGKVTAVEKVAVNKEQVVETVAELTQQLHSFGVQVRARFAETSDKVLPPAMHLSDILSVFREIQKSSEQSGLGSQVFTHVLELLTDRVETLLTLHADLKPKIEANKYLVENLLDHYQKNLLFWQEVALESEATYTKNGIRKSDHGGATLKVQA